MSRPFLRFLVVGGVAAAVNWGSRFVFSLALNLTWSIAAAYLLGMATAYSLSRLHVFERSGRSVPGELLRFALVNVVALGIVEAVTFALLKLVFPAVGFTWRPEAVAHGLGVLSPAVTSYFGHRHFTFGKVRPRAAPAPTVWALGPGEPPPLVVDLDGTLLRTDTLVESLLANGARDPWGTVRAAFALRRGRGALKAALERLGRLDVASLPLREELLAYLRDQHARGRPLHLVSAADARIVTRVAASLGLFASAHGSREGLNLKGARKRDLLLDLLPGGFSYAGDSASDLAVWARARTMVLVNPSPSVARRARALGPPVEAEVPDAPAGPATWARALRLHQWSKNALVFVPLLLGGLIDGPHVATVAAGFGLMGVAASATYLVNDMADLDADRRHPLKRSRPLAAGTLPLTRAIVAAPVMLAAALAGAFALRGAFGWTLGAYVVLTLAYSARLKRAPLVDVFVLGALYTLRVVMGMELAASAYSAWLLTFSAFFFVSLSLAKRYVETAGATGAADAAIPGRGYRPGDAPLVLALGVAAAAAAILVIIQYMVAEAFPSDVYSTPALLWITPAVVGLWVSRIWLLAQRQELDEDPVAFAVRDRFSLALGLMLAVAVVAARLL